jgi:hypothetical protein
MAVIGIELVQIGLGGASQGEVTWDQQTYRYSNGKYIKNSF